MDVDLPQGVCVCVLWSAAAVRAQGGRCVHEIDGMPCRGRVQCSAHAACIGPHPSTHSLMPAHPNAGLPEGTAAAAGMDAQRLLAMQQLEAQVGDGTGAWPGAWHGSMSVARLWISSLVLHLHSRKRMAPW